MNANKTKIGFIGCGNMAEAIITGVTKLHKDILDISVYDRHPEKNSKMQALGCDVCENISALADNCDVVFLCIKPQNFPEVLSMIKKDTGKTFVTIAAGISIDYIKSVLGKCSVIRAMPNTPLMIGEGAVAICKCNTTTDATYELVKSTFECSGVCVDIDESQMNSVICVNGSSPAFIYKFAENIIKYAVEQGIGYDKAKQLIASSLIGSAKMMLQSEDDITTLISKVTSKGGTTFAGMQALEDNGFDHSIHECCDKCTARAVELNKK